jgi:hypothetical protein
MLKNYHICEIVVDHSERLKSLIKPGVVFIDDLLGIGPFLCPNFDLLPLVDFTIFVLNLNITINDFFFNLK